MQFSKEAQKQKAITIFVTGFSILVLVLLTDAFIRNRICIAAQKQVLAGLNNNVKRVVLSPYDYGNSLVSREVVIDDRATVIKLVSAYKNMREEKAGDGRPPGQWQVLLTFVKEDGTSVDSYMLHNEFSDLIFLPTPQKQDDTGPEDFFASQEVSQILMDRLAGKQEK